MFIKDIWDFQLFRCNIIIGALNTRNCFVSFFYDSSMNEWMFY